MKETAPQFDNSTKRSAGKLAFGRDINRSVTDALSGGRGVLPPDGGGSNRFGFGDGAAWSRVFLIEVTGAESGVAKYVCNAYAPFGNNDFSDPTKDFANDSPKTEYIETSALFVNLEEYNADPANGHAITDPGNVGSRFCLALLVDHTDDNRSVFVGSLLRQEDCNTSGESARSSEDSGYGSGF